MTCSAATHIGDQDHSSRADGTTRDRRIAGFYKGAWQRPSASTGASASDNGGLCCLAGAARRRLSVIRVRAEVPAKKSRRLLPTSRHCPAFCHSSLLDAVRSLDERSAEMLFGVVPHDFKPDHHIDDAGAGDVQVFHAAGVMHAGGVKALMFAFGHPRFIARIGDAGYIKPRIPP